MFKESGIFSAIETMATMVEIICKADPETIGPPYKIHTEDFLVSDAMSLKP